ncbi:unnamed protein product [Darwinula stevensoni]|uniref:E3 ubiquitin-protein ligase parkin n=1 Tax=Darwinula stevensoni TaxID=69355 RepID=A0A7R9A3N3_9CRUS|nr:unnamed protein product [Darwinula stevensoni]CAG0882473.1 unnamed protein product [Darwinula stevensoni]
MQAFGFFRNKVPVGLHVNVRTNTGVNIQAVLDPNWSVNEVKEKIAPKLGFPASEVKIIFAGKELDDSFKLSDCDLGQQSILHAVKVVRVSSGNQATGIPLPTALAHSLPVMDSNQQGEQGRQIPHFYVYCSSCKKMCVGKLRVRCAHCKEGAIIVSRDPCSWEDVLTPLQIPGTCEVEGCGGDSVEFFFKCAEHVPSVDSLDALPLNLVKSNTRDVPCMACFDVQDLVLVFPCSSAHVTCLDCFRTYCQSLLQERQFTYDPVHGYSVPCPAKCDNSLIRDTHHFKLLSAELYARYQRFGAEEFVIASGGTFCPQPNCGMGLMPHPDCRRITCEHGCGFVFCRDCRQGYHIGECERTDGSECSSNTDDRQAYRVDPERAAAARWDEASAISIRVLTKPCPKCRTPTERDGGCMHMTCTWPQCGYHWCWVCQNEWTRDCMASHWFA